MDAALKRLSATWPKSLDVPGLQPGEDAVKLTTKLVTGGDAKNTSIQYGHSGQSCNTPALRCDWNPQHPDKSCSPRCEHAPEIGAFIRKHYGAPIDAQNAFVAERRQT